MSTLSPLSISSLINSRYVLRLACLSFAVGGLNAGLVSAAEEQKSGHSQAPALPEQSGEMQADEEAAIRSRLMSAVPGLEVARISISPIPNVYEIETANQQLLYVSASGDYFIAGDIFKLEEGRIVNLAEERRESARAEAIASVPQTDKVVFKPEGEPRAVVNVFTDVDCGYCRKLHQEVPALLKQGIQVNYLAFPRAGVGSSSYDKLVAVWCADDRLEAMNQAKAGKSVPLKQCTNGVASQYDLGGKIGISGTPAIVLDDGRLIPGYLPADMLTQNLGLSKL
ncbi:hypothetical protein GCM10022278_36490 [Allohahella marinimesophila]|uniref:Thiol:disulfide interchange protein n=2 Tax=Allohahella marinimesophila TaxID=1054972 RepID=A0ABP7Q4V7_9GAMM